MKNTFAIGLWDIRIFDADSLTNMTYHGKPARFGFKLARPHNKLGSINIELIQPLEGENVYSDFLRQHGEGIHHIGSHMVNSITALVETSRRLENAGFTCIMSGRTHWATFAYFDTTKLLNTILEVMCASRTDV